MNLKRRLLEKKSSIVTTWREAALVVPEGKAPEFLEKQKTLIADVMKYDLKQGMAGLFDALLEGVIPDDVSRFLDSMVRIRAISDFTAAHAVAFLVEIKKAVRRELGNDVLNEPDLGEELAAWDAAVDDLVLFAFDSYMRYREKILELQAEEEKQKTLRLLKKAKLIPEDQEEV